VGYILRAFKSGNDTCKSPINLVALSSTSAGNAAEVCTAGIDPVRAPGY